MHWRHTRPVSPVAIALLLVVLSTLVTLVTAIIDYASDGQPTAERIHSYSFTGMLGTYAILVFASIIHRKSQPVMIEIAPMDNFLFIAHCNSKSLWVVDEESAKWTFREWMQSIRNSDLRQIQIVSLQSMTMTDPMIQFLQCLPNLRVLDLQKAKVPSDCWGQLERCRSLERILLHGALSFVKESPHAPAKEVELKEVVMTLPEIKFHLEPTALLLRRLSSRKKSTV